MGILSNHLCRDKLKPGDHIYSWRNAYIYSHHGIYVGDDRVIHFTQGGGLETGTGTFLDKIIVSSIPDHGTGGNPCPKCGDQPKQDGVISSCLDCFLAGGNLYLFEYSVSKAAFVANLRGGTCTTATSDPCDEVISRAEILFLINGFGPYHLLDNNCEDFAIYCKTGLIVLPKTKLGTSGQANSASGAGGVASWTVGGLVGLAVKSRGKAVSVVTSGLGFVATGFGGLMLAGFTKYSVDCLLSDVGMRTDVSKVPVEKLVGLTKAMEDLSDYKSRDTWVKKMGLFFHKKMGFLSHKISRDDLKDGDHIYSWRTAYFYSHHGIYVGDGKVIHFTRGGGQEIGTGTILDKIIDISTPNQEGIDKKCLDCGDQSNLDGVISSCLDCFLAGGNLHLFEYNASPSIFLAKRGGTCTIATSGPCDEVISRAEYLLSRNGFGEYDLFDNNCEDFALYCKTGLFVLSKATKSGSSGQANSVPAASVVSELLSSTVQYVVPGVGGMVLAKYGSHCVGRLFYDVGVRKDACKVSVEELVAFLDAKKGILESNK